MNPTVVQRLDQLLASVVVVAKYDMALAVQAVFQQPSHVINFGTILVLSAIALAAVGVDPKHVATKRTRRRSEHEPFNMILLWLGRVANLVARVTSEGNPGLINGEILRVVRCRLPRPVEQTLQLRRT